MPVQDSAPKPNKIVWALAGLLCLCTLVALWVTGARVKALKMAARRGEVIEPIGMSADPGQRRLVLHPERQERAGHFSLFLDSRKNVVILDAGGRRLVEFQVVKKGQLRRWQELQLAVVDVSPDAVTVEVEFKPGSACFGDGRYRALRPGLRIEFGPTRSLTVSAWDPQKPQITLKFQSPQGEVERQVALDGNGEVFDMSYRLQCDPDGGHALLVGTID